ncbi:hypothetical protein [Shimia sp. Alg240-R146]|uniref:hypothetical protein n=1 Tax=Shimia sp. Alg240-R146 TaxID=2993449 RepID=UPI0022E861CB|nr:hypothetical protein [Shimia sp. Alg240-R146]
MAEFIFVIFIGFLSLALWWGHIFFPLIWRARVSPKRHTYATIALILSLTAIALTFIVGPVSTLIVAAFPPVFAFIAMMPFEGVDAIPKMRTYFFFGLSAVLFPVLATTLSLRRHMSAITKTAILCAALYFGTHVGILAANRPYQSFLHARAIQAGATCININTLHGVFSVADVGYQNSLHTLVIVGDGFKYWSFKENAFVEAGAIYGNPDNAMACKQTDLIRKPMRLFSKY